MVHTSRRLGPPAAARFQRDVGHRAENVLLLLLGHHPAASPPTHHVFLVPSAPAVIPVLPAPPPAARPRELLSEPTSGRVRCDKLSKLLRRLRRSKSVSKRKEQAEHFCSASDGESGELLRSLVHACKLPRIIRTNKIKRSS